MKKILILFSLLLFLTVSGVDAATAYGNFEFQEYDNKNYDLITGEFYDDINYSATNRIIIPMNTTDPILYFNNQDFHHILFYDDFNKYLGYINTDKSDLQLSTYLGYDVYPNHEADIPTKASRFALVVYNYNDTRIQTVFTYPSIDDIIFNELSYRDIFQGTNEYPSALGVEADYYFGSGYNTGIIDTLTTQYNDRDYNDVVQSAVNWDKNTTGAPVIVNRYNLNFQTILDHTQPSSSAVDGLLAVRIGNDTFTIFDVNYLTSNDIEGCGISGTSGNLFISIIKTKLPNNGVNDTASGITPDWEAYLQANDVEFIYELDTPITRDAVNILSDIKILNLGYSPFLYNFTDIFGVDIPDDADFMDWRTYYNLNYSTSGDELNYNDIFGSNTKYGGTNNIIDNGNFRVDINLDDIADGFAGYRYSIANINNGQQIFSDGLYDSFGLYSAYDVLENHDYYLTLDIFSNLIIFDAYKIRDVNNAYHRVTDINISTFSIIETSLTSQTIAGYIQVDKGSLITDLTDYLLLNNYRIYDLTTIFLADHEPDTTTFESYYDVWEDPYEDNYTQYYFLINLSLLDIQYQYDDTPAAPLDTQTSIDDALFNLGADSAEMQVFTALGIMVIVAVLIGLKTKNTMFVVMAEAVLILIFAMLGWFSFWILLLIALISVLLLFKTILKRE